MIQALNGLSVATGTVQPKVKAGEGATDLAGQFGGYLSDAMTKLANQQAVVETLNEKFITGEISDVHTLTIAAEKASLGLEFTVQVRNKAIEAYQDIMRMQI
ncbi:flagellar hook-basal body complex protein FliE [Paenibacillus contaminans]|uniref:Flagellar hook-basal body complex protein FliE n=1 Tax=Paenibacillus contaminans TaxID=450362 RepID=A0A329MVW1_9BACL|nr:flagellar hook-basal body complex protein FliE [Paenibacillus contaminans]RAV22703.1 flagellar hook-basal body complex protein FliE [Paenibacillus contaminans]